MMAQDRDYTDAAVAEQAWQEIVALATGDEAAAAYCALGTAVLPLPPRADDGGLLAYDCDGWRILAGPTGWRATLEAQATSLEEYCGTVLTRDFGESASAGAALRDAVETLGLWGDERRSEQVGEQIQAWHEAMAAEIAHGAGVENEYGDDAFPLERVATVYVGTDFDRDFFRVSVNGRVIGELGWSLLRDSDGRPVRDADSGDYVPCAVGWDGQPVRVKPAVVTALRVAKEDIAARCGRLS
jgi:hypothetical protein